MFIFIALHTLLKYIFPCITQHPEYARRLELLPDYRNSLNVRYPPVCNNCLPAVEEEIRTKDHMARTKALGGWLKQSKGKEKQRKVSGSGKEREKLGVQLAAWRVRGCLWALTLILSIVANLTRKYHNHPHFALGAYLDGGCSRIGIFHTPPIFTSATCSACSGTCFTSMGCMGSDLCGVPQGSNTRP